MVYGSQKCRAVAYVMPRRENVVTALALNYPTRGVFQAWRPPDTINMHGTRVACVSFGSLAFRAMVYSEYCSRDCFSMEFVGTHTCGKRANWLTRVLGRGSRLDCIPRCAVVFLVYLGVVTKRRTEQRCFIFFCSQDADARKPACFPRDITAVRHPLFSVPF